MRYRKKPVIIDAFQYDGDLKDRDGKYYVPDWAVKAYKKGVMHYGTAKFNETPELFIDTLEGTHHVSVGDYVIRGIKGELYPCKPDIFIETYEKAEKKDEKINNWIPVSERLPEPEVEVLITTKIKYKSGKCIYVVTSAMYEDGTVLENDSIWNWIDIDGKYDEENDCYIVPEGWWEYRHYNPDEVYNNLVDDEVIAWMPLPEPYREDKDA